LFATHRLKTWNPGWAPERFMVDKAMAEHNAVKLVFPDAIILLCDFHVLHAMWKWVNSGKSGIISQDSKKRVFALLASIKSASTEQVR
jgi:hypothetical protein